MKIIKLVLHKYRRLSLNNIDTLTFTPDKHLQIILGSNLSGKSSTLKELSPLPAELKKEYKEDGYKQIIIEHNGNTYDISSGLVGKNKHSFKVNDVEMNEANIRKIQLELVKEHFKLTPQIHEILLGNSKFTNMSLSERKKWLTLISNIDYTYPIKVYNDLKSTYRDVTGGLRLANNKLLQDDLKMLKDTDREKLTNDLKVLHDLTEHLISTKTIVRPRDTSPIENIKQLNSRISNTLNTLSNSNYKNPNRLLVDIDTKIAVISNKIIDIKKELDKLTNISVNTDKDSITKELNTIESKMIELTKDNIYNINLNEIDTIYNSYKSIYTELVSLINNISEMSDVTYNTDNFNKCKDLIEALRVKIEAYSKRLEKIKVEVHNYDELLNKPNIECVNCGHSWKLNYDEVKHNKLKEALVKHNEEITNLKNKLEQTKNLYDKYVTKKNLIENAKLYIKNNLILRPIFSYIFTKHDIQTESNSVITELNKATIILDKLKSYSSLKSTKDELYKKLEILKANDEIRKELTGKNKDVLEKELANLINTKENLLKEKNTITSYIAKKDELEKLHDMLRNNLKNSKEYFNYRISEVKNNYINEAINTLKHEIAKIETTLKEDELVKSRISNITKEISEYKDRESVLKILVKELSPTEGLIAKSINSFLNLFITDMNNVIGHIWTHDISILPCNLEEGDLDYKFPVSINNNEIINDVSIGSSGLKEAIDLAFKVVFMKYLGLEDYPLYLDEYAVNMDIKHRANAYSAIESILAPNFSQVFLISHFESMYGRFTNVDISVLSKDNLMLDDNLIYNKVMSI